MWKQKIILKQPADPAAFGRYLNQVDAVQQNASVAFHRGCEISRDIGQERGFSTTTRTHQGHDLAGLYGEREAFDQQHIANCEADFLKEQGHVFFLPNRAAATNASAGTTA